MPKTRPQNPRFFFGSATGGVGVGALGCATVSGAGAGAAAAGAGVGAGVMVADASVIGGARRSRW